MTVLAFLTDPAVVTRVLAHLGLPAHPPPLAPARARDSATVVQGYAPYDDALNPGTDLHEVFPRKPCPLPRHRPTRQPAEAPCYKARRLVIVRAITRITTAVHHRDGLPKRFGDRARAFKARTYLRYRCNDLDSALKCPMRGARAGAHPVVAERCLRFAPGRRPSGGRSRDGWPLR
jgi:hypothetical protein